MQRICAAVVMAMSMGIVTPQVGVTQDASTLSATRLADTLLAADTPEAHHADSVSYEIDPFAAVVPFGPGERLEYKVKLGIFNAGEAHMEVLGIDMVRGKPSYHVDVAMKGGLLFYKLNSRYESWIDTELITSHRYVSDESYTGYSSYRSFEFYPDEMIWDQTDEDVIGELATALPLDEISFIYFVRSSPLEVGQTYQYSRYFKKEEGNPVILEVERRDVRETAAGTFNTIVVRPTFQTDGLFADGGDAELHFTDDENRYLVYMRVGMPFIGSITLHLENIVPGTPIHTGAHPQ